MNLSPDADTLASMCPSRAELLAAVCAAPDDDAPGLERLRSLSLADLRIGDEGARALAGCAALANVRWIDLSRNAIGRAGVEALARSALMADMLFVLDGNPCDPIERPSFDWDGSVADVTSPGFPSEIEAAVGHRVAWLRYPWTRAGQKPDRFHA